MTTNAYLAIDLGAETGRVALGVMRDGDLCGLHEVHRFPNAPVILPSGLHWDITGLWREILQGMRLAVDHCHRNDFRLVSVGVDTFGVDFGLLGAGGELLALPHAYRDPQHDSAYEHALNVVGKDAIYQATGIQFMPLNTLYQLVGLRGRETALLDAADRIAFLPDLIHYFLSGTATIERTIASTSQMMTPGASEWATDLLQQLDVPVHMLGETIDPGETIGAVRPDVLDLIGSGESILVVAPPAHDTASAVAAVPADPSTNWCYLSSGTWSLLGAELDSPHITQDACNNGFTNEAGVDGTIRFHTNIIGLWIVQECRRSFDARTSSYDYSKLIEFAAAAEPFRTLIDTDHPPFMQQGAMTEKIAAFARQTAQPEPIDPGQFVRCCFEGLAFSYRKTLQSLESVLDRRFDVIHIVGGGSKNNLLNKMTADATGRRVLAGPAEATAMGNLLTQAIASEQIRDFAHAREIARASVAIQVFEPAAGGDWDEHAERWAALRGSAAAVG